MSIEIAGEDRDFAKEGPVFGFLACEVIRMPSDEYLWPHTMLDLPHRLVLCSASPRRQELLKTIVRSFDVRPVDFDESFPSSLQQEDIVCYLAREKAKRAVPFLKPGELGITADTIVWFEGQALNKPADRQEAMTMLQRLSGREHSVYTGVCLFTATKQTLFYAHTRVWFKQLATDEIAYYVDHHPPLDKAGAYGAQDFIGMVGVEKIEGSFYNVMGLPMKELYEQLKHFDD